MILDKIAASTRLRVEQKKQALPLETIRDRALADSFTAPYPFPFERALAMPGLSFICEVKKASPSRGIIAKAPPEAPDFPCLRIARDYEAAGAAAISVLTEPEYFLGKDEYLRDIAQTVSVPTLRKDFVIDAYQIYEASLLGAKAILLICALLESPVLREYIGIADSLGLSALVETHSAEEVRSALDAGARIIGINNRDLKTFAVDLTTTAKLRKRIPPGILTVSESGIRSAGDIRALGGTVDAVLIGEILMRATDKKERLRELRDAARAARAVPEEIFTANPVNIIRQRETVL
jgi:indole-3-glycerol phosphate synthase